MKVSAYYDDWKSIIYCRLENQQIDFKAPQNWNAIGRTGRAKLARHAIAMANTLGGYVVIGVGEDANGTPNQYIGMTEEEAGSFDPSAVGQSISSFADPPVSLDIVRPLVDGRRYVVMVIYPFKDLPHVCSSACENELQRGAFYIRTPDARSKVAVKASELHLIIQRCLRNQRQMLGRMLRGILYEDRQSETPELDIFPVLLGRSRHNAMERLGKSQIHSKPYFELSCHPNKVFHDVGLADARRGIEAIERPSMEELSGMGATIERFATNESQCGMQSWNGAPMAFWEFYKSGFLYLAVLFPVERSDAKTIPAGELSQMLLASVRVLGQLYTNIGHPEAILDIALRIPNSDGAAIEGLKHGTPSNGVCRVMDIEVTKRRSAGDLEGGATADTAAQLFAEACELFNVHLDQSEVAEIKLEYQTSL